MKKITLALLTAFGLSSGIFGQAIVTIQAPLADGSWSTLHAPSGSLSAVNEKACYLVLQSELTALANTNSVITAFGFDFLNGVNAPTSGQFTVYLQNTTDVTYLKGANFATAIAPMSTNFVGVYNIPVSTNPTQTLLTLTTPFNYTGGGIYVAFEWDSPTASATTRARYNTNTTDLTPIGGGYTFTPAGPAASTMSLDVFRPAFLWGTVNTLTNEVGATGLDAYGKVSKLFNTAQTINAQIRNNSNTALSNVSVSLAITGANPFNTSTVVPSIGAGSFVTIPFAGYTPTANGTSTMSLLLDSDDNNANNSKTWLQEVTCDQMAINPPVSATAFTNNTYQWATGGGIYSYRMISPVASTLTGIKFAVSSFTNVVGKNIYGVLMNSTGSIVATTNTINVAQAQLGTFVTFTFANGQAITPGINYNYGVAQPDFPCQVFGSITSDNAKTFLCGLTGGALSIANRGYMGMEAVLSFSSSLNVTASKTVVCKADAPNTVTLTASGLSSYTWSPVSSTNSVIVVTPSVSGTGGGVVIYNVTGTDGTSGCKSGLASITVSVSTCTGLADNNSNGFDIKLFPNPAVNGKATVTGLIGINNITVYNALGQIVATQVVSEESTNIDLSSQPSGNYMVKITDSNSESRIIKLLNQK